MNQRANPEIQRLSARRIVCPAVGWEGPGTVTIRGDRIEDLRPALSTPPTTFSFDSGAVLLPGLIDLHAHPAKSGSRFGIDPDPHCLLRGATTVLSQGDAGAATIADYIRETVLTARTDVRVAINLSSRGEVGPHSCFSNPQWLDVRACLQAIENFRPSIWGIAVNASHHSCGATDPRQVLRTALNVAEHTGLPLLYGMRRPEDWPLAEQLQALRPGDVVTYCYRKSPYGIVDRGHVLPEVHEARRQGILFDVGHGQNSFDFETAEAAIRDGFLPDTISTDLQRGHLGQSPPHDLPLVMSKLRAAGMHEADIFRAVTLRPAQILKSDHEIGTLHPQSRADLTVLRWTEASEPLADTSGAFRLGGRWQAIATLRAGVWISSQDR